jgi:hypothetical protein
MPLRAATPGPDARRHRRQLGHPVVEWHTAIDHDHRKRHPVYEQGAALQSRNDRARRCNRDDLAESGIGVSTSPTALRAGTSGSGTQRPFGALQQFRPVTELLFTVPTSHGQDPKLLSMLTTKVR